MKAGPRKGRIRAKFPRLLFPWRTSRAASTVATSPGSTLATWRCGLIIFFWSLDFTKNAIQTLLCQHIFYLLVILLFLVRLRPSVQPALLQAYGLPAAVFHPRVNAKAHQRVL